MALSSTARNVSDPARLTPLTEHPDWYLRQIAMGALTERRDPAFATYLRSRLTGDDSTLVKEAVEALDDESARAEQDTLVGILSHQDRPWEWTRRAVANRLTAPSDLVTALADSSNGVVHDAAMTPP